MTPVTPPDDAPEPPLTFTAYAARIGKSRPYISKLVKEGKIHGPALTDAHLIHPAIADAQRAAAADPARTRTPQTLPQSGDTTYAAERARLTTAQADRAELELKARNGELIPRTAVAAIIPAAARRYRDALAQHIRDTVTDDVERATLLDRFATTTETFIAEALTNGGAPPPDA